MGAILILNFDESKYLLKVYGVPANIYQTFTELSDELCYDSNKKDQQKKTAGEKQVSAGAKNRERKGENG